MVDDDAATMEYLANEGDGVWSAICEEGAAVGHGSTMLAIMI